MVKLSSSLLLASTASTVTAFGPAAFMQNAFQAAEKAPVEDDAPMDWGKEEQLEHKEKFDDWGISMLDSANSEEKHKDNHADTAFADQHDEFLGGFKEGAEQGLHAFASDEVVRQQDFQTIDGPEWKRCGQPFFDHNSIMSGSRSKQKRSTNGKGPGRIVGGNDAVPHSWPWQIWLDLDGGPWNAALCGGMLISPRYVMTAAHCAYEGMTGYARVGAHYRTDDMWDENSDDIEVRRIFPHPMWMKQYDTDGSIKDRMFAHDYSIVELSRDVDPRDYKFNNGTHSGQVVNPVCLPPKNKCQQALDRQCVVTGWGLTHELENRAQENLQETRVNILDYRDCNNKYYKPSYIHDDSMFCAGHDAGRFDACSGDSGGPLICRDGDNDPWYLYGVVSWGQGCGRRERPGIYAHVSSVNDWITEVTGLRSPFPDAEPFDTNDLGRDYCRHVDPDYERKQEVKEVNEIIDEQESGIQWPPALTPMADDWLRTADVKHEEACENAAGNYGGFRWKERFELHRLPGRGRPWYYHDDKTMVYTFGLNCKAAEDMVEKGQKPHVYLKIRDLWTKSKTRRCSDNGSTDYLECIDATGKLLLKNACQARYRSKRTHLKLKGVAPIYCRFNTNNDKLREKGLNNAAFTVYGVDENSDQCGLAKQYVIKESDTEVVVKTKQWPKYPLPQNAVCKTHIVGPPNSWVVCSMTRRFGDGIRVQHPEDRDCDKLGMDVQDSIHANDADAPTVTRLCGVKYDGVTMKGAGNMFTVNLHSSEKYFKKYNSGFQMRCKAIKQALWWGADTRSQAEALSGDSDAREIHERNEALAEIEDVEEFGGFENNW